MAKRIKRPLTPAYIIFYILFWPDTWRILTGLALSVLITPHIIPADLGTGGRAMLHVMVAAIGWAVSSKPAGWVTGKLRSLTIKR